VTIVFALDSLAMRAPARTASRSSSQESESGGFTDQLQEATKPDLAKPGRIKGKAQENKQPREDGDPTVVVPALLPMMAQSAPFSLDFDLASSDDMPGQPGPMAGKSAGARSSTISVILAPEVVAIPGEPSPAPQSGKQPEQTGETTSPLNASSAEARPELAFAARIQPASSVAAPASDAHAPVLAHSTVPAVPKKTDMEEEPVAQGSVSQPLPHPVVATYVRSADRAPASVSQPVTDVPRAEMPTPKMEEQPKAVEPLKSLSIQLPRSNSDRVEVRLTQQANEVHVAVRTADTALANGLREGLSDLVGQLQQTGFRTDTWRPTGGAPAAAPVHETQNTSAHTHSGDYQSNSGGSQQDSGQRNQNQANRPRWVEELESSKTGGGN
jgi:hypothetical protein